MIRAFILLISFTVISNADTYYVDYVSGSDAAAGTSSGVPWKHCPGDAAATGNANITLSAGDTVVFHGGIRYDVANVVSGTSSGSAGTPITYLSGHLANPQWGSGPALINCTNASTNSVWGAMDLSGKSFLTVNGLTLVGYGLHTYSGQIGGQWVSGGNILIENCSMSNSTSSGVYIRGIGMPSGFTISNCVMANLDGHGVYAHGGMTNLQVLNCNIHDIGAISGGDNVGLFAIGGTTYSNVCPIIRSNDFSNAVIKSPIIIDAVPTIGAVIEKNYIHGNFGFSGFDLNSTFTNLWIRNNVWDMAGLNFYGPITFNTDAGTVYADGVYIYNNTLRTTVPGSGMVVYFGSGNNTATTAFWHVFFTNNIVIQSTANRPVVVVASNQASTGPIVDAATFHCDNNVYVWISNATPFTWNGSAKNFAAWQTASVGDAHSQTTSPTFVSGSDLHLAAGDTVARGNGANLYSLFTADKDGNSRPSSGPWDIGAYEYTSGAGDASLSLSGATIQMSGATMQISQ